MSSNYTNDDTYTRRTKSSTSLVSTKKPGGKTRTCSNCFFGKVDCRELEGSTNCQRCSEKHFNACDLHELTPQAIYERTEEIITRNLSTYGSEIPPHPISLARSNAAWAKPRSKSPSPSRASMSCVRCTRSKVKCEYKQGDKFCKQCSKRNPSECVFDKEGKSRSNKKHRSLLSSEVSSLNNRQLEELVSLPGGLQRINDFVVSKLGQSCRLRGLDSQHLSVPQIPLPDPDQGIAPISREAYATSASQMDTLAAIGDTEVGPINLPFIQVQLPLANDSDSGGPYDQYGSLAAHPNTLFNFGGDVGLPQIYNPPTHFENFGLENADENPRYAYNPNFQAENNENSEYFK